MGSIGTAQEVWEDFTEPYVEDWENGREGEAIGRGLVELGANFIPGYNVLRWLNRFDDANSDDGPEAPEAPPSESGSSGGNELPEGDPPSSDSDGPIDDPPGGDPPAAGSDESDDDDSDSDDGGEPEDTSSGDGDDEPSNGSVPKRAAELDEATRDWHPNARQHIFQGNFNPQTGQLAGGLHTQAGLDAFLERTEFQPISPPETLENGVKRVEFPPEALTDRAQRATEISASEGRGIPNGKTIFPEDWDENKIADALNQAKDQGVEIRSSTWGGSIKTFDVDGVKVEVALDRDGNIVSGYPSWNQ